jgi:hypothetical protein
MDVDSTRLIWALMELSEDGPGELAQIEEEIERSYYWTR